MQLACEIGPHMMGDWEKGHHHRLACPNPTHPFGYGALDGALVAPLFKVESVSTLFFIVDRIDLMELWWLLVLYSRTYRLC